MRRARLDGFAHNKFRIIYVRDVFNYEIYNYTAVHARKGTNVNMQYVRRRCLNRQERRVCVRETFSHTSSLNLNLPSDKTSSHPLALARKV